MLSLNLWNGSHDLAVDVAILSRIVWVMTVTGLLAAILLLLSSLYLGCYAAVILLFRAREEGRKSNYIRTLAISEGGIGGLEVPHQRLDSIAGDQRNWRSGSGEGSDGADGGMPLRPAAGDCRGRAGAGLSLSLPGLPAAHRYRFPFRRDLSEGPGPARRRAQDLRARCRQRQPDPLLFLPQLRQQPVLGKRPQPGRLWGRGRCFRSGKLPAAERLDLGSVDAPLARPALRHGAPRAGPAADQRV